MFTSGKVYYELAAKRAEMGAQQDIAIVRVEQVRAVLVAIQPQWLRLGPAYKWMHKSPKDIVQAYWGVVSWHPQSPEVVANDCLQIAPFPFDLVLRELRRYPNAEIMWAQVRFVSSA